MVRVASASLLILELLEATLSVTKTVKRFIILLLIFAAVVLELQLIVIMLQVRKSSIIAGIFLSKVWLKRIKREIWADLERRVETSQIVC